jgi:hypothetical protein
LPPAADSAARQLITTTSAGGPLTTDHRLSLWVSEIRLDGFAKVLIPYAAIGLNPDTRLGVDPEVGGWRRTNSFKRKWVVAEPVDDVIRLTCAE